MNASKVHPKTVMLTVFIILFIGTVFFSIILFTERVENFVLCMVIGTSFSLLMVALNYFLHGISIEDSKLVIKLDGARGYKKYTIELSNIKKLEYINRKILGSKLFIVLVYFTEGNEEKMLEIKNSIYFEKDLRIIFNIIQTNYQIPFTEYQ
ncbi:hypothetical protein D7Z26_00215 [Cohnella endophytica]|uniref:Uncharacterized protein n=1 Tax=Cohnella endophytica TaxID=2419778 RepID=A0A494YBG3_9BACL|nr:hypothetical protein [Cohnella endophytica]RKP57976.1 hypothetical protein D7Z26_00215 [Cohnella endophytica]